MADRNRTVSSAEALAQQPFTVMDCFFVLECQYAGSPAEQSEAAAEFAVRIGGRKCAHCNRVQFRHTLRCRAGRRLHWSGQWQRWGEAVVWGVL